MISCIMIAMPKKPIDLEDTLTPEEEKLVAKGMRQLRRGQFVTWKNSNRTLIVGRNAKLARSNKSDPRRRELAPPDTEQRSRSLDMIAMEFLPYWVKKVWRVNERQGRG